MPDLGLDELEAIGAIYGEDAIVRLDERMVELHLPNRHAVPRISLQLHLPRDYPATSPPLVSLACVPDRIDSTLLDWAASFVEILFIPEKEVLLDYIQWLGQQREMFGEGPEEADHDDREAEEVDPGGMPDLDGLRLEEEKPHPIPLPRIASDEEEVRIQMMAPRIVTGQPIVEKRSTFLAHCCRVNDVKEVRAVIQALLRRSKIKQATHPCIMAYRINKTTSDCDDDGESGAGGRLLHLLHMTEAISVVVVVTRWFGGTLLGPSRFGIISNCARRVLEDEGFIKPGGKARGVLDGTQR